MDKLEQDQNREEPIRDAGEILGRLVEGDDELQREVESARLSIRIAEMLYEARASAGLTQAQLAKLVGTTQSVISRLEDANYEGHSLAMLLRVATALNKRVEVRLTPRVA
jgi:ribosome-binding protein aMBF1 (putative translation factor)